MSPGKDRRWIRKQLSDPYYRKAKKKAYPSRSAFKLEQIQKQTRIFKAGQKVVDLCCAPGGWMKIIHKLVGNQGSVLGVDLQNTATKHGMVFLKGDIQSPDVYDKLPAKFKTNVDVVVSDCSPKTTGVKDLDQYRQIELVKAAWLFGMKTMKPGGVFLTKIFQGKDADEFVASIRGDVEKIRQIKPLASRKSSKEMYLVVWTKKT
jgi:23S rRNA (uridine2552-2'-O)-methyltransferase